MAFLPVKRQNISDTVTEKIKEAILKGKFKHGDKIPSERELVEQFQVSRIVVREALRRLEANGLLIIKRGSGMFVTDTGSKPMSDALTSVLKMRKVNIDEITEARLLMEPAIARLAAERMTPEYLKKLEANIQEAESLVEDKVVARLINIEFHEIIAEASQNVVIRLSLKAVLYALGEIDAPRKSTEVRDTVAIDYHKQIVEALKAKDPKKSAKLMYDHIVKVREILALHMKGGRGRG